jgi:hypothetical protein
MVALATFGVRVLTSELQPHTVASITALAIVRNEDNSRRSARTLLPAPFWRA